MTEISKPLYRNPQAPIAERVSDLLRRMSVSEKVHQIASFFPNANVRLGIPHIQQGECLHGVAAPGATSFPQALALGSTWDPALIERVAGVIAREARALGIHHCYSPMLGVARDPRWGRTGESYGEDPWLVSRIGAAFIHGLQGRGEKRLDKEHIIATAKHLAADGEPLAGANGAAVEISLRSLHEVHLFPFKVAVQQAQVGAIMPAHHSVNGVPCHANRYLLQEVLRDLWGFEGFVVSDNGDIRQLAERLGTAEDLVDAGHQALAAGVDTELAWLCPWDQRRVYGQLLVEAVEAGEIDKDLLDQATSRALTAKFALGLFDNGEPVDPAQDPTVTAEGLATSDEQVSYADTKRSYGTPRADCAAVLQDPEHDALALETARKAIILLKNEGGLLPLNRQRVRKVAVIGPNATAVRLGGYSTPEPKHYVNIVQGLRDLLGPEAVVTHVDGCDPVTMRANDISGAIDAAQAADVVVLAIGGSELTCKENQDRDELALAGDQLTLAQAVVATGRPVVAVLLHGRPNAIPWVAEHVPAILEGWYLGQECGTAVAEALFGVINPGGRLPITVPRSTGQVPCFYNRLPIGRPYNYYEANAQPLFPFGYGLSYTGFGYSAPRLSAEEIDADEQAWVDIDVTNTGSRAGDEVVQLYIHDVVASLTRPSRELKGFERITLQPGECRTISFEIGAAQLAFWKQGRWIVEPGVFEVLLGPNSVELQAVELRVRS